MHLNTHVLPSLPPSLTQTQVLVGGFKDGKPFLGHLDMIGTAFSDDVMATGFGSYLALPIMRKRWHENMTEGEARALLEDCMRVLFYRYVLFTYI